MSKRIITINRMYGSGGHAIGKALAEELEIGFYDKELIEIAARDKNIPSAILLMWMRNGQGHGVFL